MIFVHIDRLRTVHDDTQTVKIDIILYEDQIARISFIMAPMITQAAAPTAMQFRI